MDPFQIRRPNRLIPRVIDLAARLTCRVPLRLCLHVATSPATAFPMRRAFFRSYPFLRYSASTCRYKSFRGQ